MNVMKTSLTIIPMCPRERFSLYKSLSRLVLFYKKDWATLLHFIYFCYLLLVTNYPITKLSVTYYFSACREYLAENCLSFPSTPRRVRHLLIERTTIDPLYLWVITNTNTQNNNQRRKGKPPPCSGGSSIKLERLLN